LLKLKKKTKEIEIGTKEWSKAVEEVAEMLDIIEFNFWKIGDIAKDIPTEHGKRTDLLMGTSKFTPLQQFAIEVSHKTTKYKKWQTAYDRICFAKSVSLEFEPEERHEELTLNHHVAVSKLVTDKTERQKYLDRAEEEDWTTKEMVETIKEEKYPEMTVTEIEEPEDLREEFIIETSEMCNKLMFRLSKPEIIPQLTSEQYGDLKKRLTQLKDRIEQFLESM